MEGKVCPQCSLKITQAGLIRCPRCNTLLLTPCNGECRHCPSKSCAK